MGVSVRHVLLFLQFMVSLTQGYSDYSVHQCRQGSSIEYHCIGLWYMDLATPQYLPCKQDLVGPCKKSIYAPVNEGPMHHVHIDFKICQNPSNCLPATISSGPPLYTTKFKSSSLTVDLKSMVVITGIKVKLSQMVVSTVFNYTINISPDEINWEPLLDHGKLLLVSSSDNNGVFCLTRKLFGKFLKIQLYEEQDDFRMNGNIDMYVTKDIVTAIQHNNSIPDKVQFRGCFRLYENNYEGLVHSGLTISQAVNLDECLLHCSILSYPSILVINAVRCTCTNRTLYGSSLYQYHCNSPIPIDGLPAASVFTSLYPVPDLLQFPNQVILHQIFKTSTNYTANGKHTIFYNLGDGNEGKTCRPVTHRYRYLGTFSVSLTLFDEFGNNSTTEGQVSVVDPPFSLHTMCPTFAVLNTNFSCRMTLRRGTNITVTVEYGDGATEYAEPNDSYHYEIGENPAEATETTGNDTIVFVGYPVKQSGQLHGFEFSLSKAGPLRIQILTNPDVQDPIEPDQSNHRPKGTTCNAEMFDIHNQCCCSSVGGCQSTEPPVNEDLTGYKCSYDIMIGRYSSKGHNYIPVPYESPISVTKGDIVVIQQDAQTGLLAKSNESRNTTTALVFSTGIINMRVGDTFQSGVKPIATRELFAFNMILSANISHDIVYAYPRDGSFWIKISAQAPVGPVLTNSQLITVQEKIHSVNITIPRLGLVNRISVFNIEAFGTNITVVVSFGDGLNRTFSNVQRIQPIQYLYNTKGVFNITVYIFNKVSWYWMKCQYETIIPVEHLSIIPCNKGVVYGNGTNITTSLMSGDYANISTNFGDGSEGHFVSNISVIDRVLTNMTHTFPHLGAYNVTAFATNGLSNETTVCILYLEIPIEGLNVSNMSTIVNAEHNVRFSLIPQGGTNHTYNGTLNDKAIEIRCVSDYCSRAEVLLLAESYLDGENTIKVCVFNRVTSPHCITFAFTAYYVIRGTALNHPQVYLVDQPMNVSVSFQNGSDVSCFLEIQGHQGMLQKCAARFPMTRSITCTTSGFFTVLANCSNVLNFEYLESTFTCMYPVRQLLLTSDSPQSVYIGTINFTLSHVNPVPSNATCYVDFGDNDTMLFQDCILPLNFSHKYEGEGDYPVIASAYNQLTRGTSSVYAKVEEPVEVIILKMERGPRDPMYGEPGGGPLQNMFPLEYPMTLRIVRMDGTRPNVEWKFGDNETHLENNTVRTLTHTCPAEGLYNFTVRAFNKISSLSSYMIYECRPSIKCKLYENSPFLTYQPANMTLVLENPDFLTAVIMEFGDGEYQVLGTSARKNDFPGMPYKVIEPMLENVTVTHLFSKEGEYKVNCNATNTVSHHEFLNVVVFSLHKPCRKPKVEILNVGKFVNMSKVRNETRKYDFVIVTKNIIDCEASRATIFQWKVFLYNGPGLLDTPLDHPLWKLNGSKLIIPKQTIPIGIIRFEFTLRMEHKYVQNVLGRTDGYITISPSIPQVSIPGGLRRSEDVIGTKIISADFIDFDALNDNISDVTWQWFVAKDNNDTSKLSLISEVQEDGCFGYSTGKLPFLLSSFEYNASLITTRITCRLQVIATRANRIAKYEQQVEFFPGVPPPKLGIMCKVNCENPNPVEILSYEGYSNIDYTLLDLEWQLWSEGKMIDLPGKTLTSRRSRNLVLARGSLEGGKYYRLIFFAWIKGNESNKGFVETQFKTNDAPQGGKCDINPKIGYAVITTFRINCSGWEDKDKPISYRVTIDSEIEGFLFSGREINQPIYLPFHHGNDTSSLVLKVYIIDSHGNYNVTTVSAVIRTSENDLQSINEAIKMNGNLLNDILGGNTQTASQLLSSVASVIIHSATEVESDTDNLDIEERLESFINIAAEIPCQLPEDVLAIAESLVELTVKPNLLNLNVQGTAPALFDSMLNVLSDTKNLASVEQIELASTNILTGMGSIFVSTSMHLSEDVSIEQSEMNFTKTEAKKNIDSLLSSVDKIFGLLYSNMLLGQNYTVVDTPYISLLTGQKSFKELSESSIGIKHSSFDIPDSLMQSALNTSSLDLPAMIKVFSLTENPFLWTPTAKTVDSNIISLDLGNQSGESLPVRNLSEKMQIEIKNKNLKSKSFQPRTYSSKGNDVSTHRINVTTNDSSIHGSVHPINCSAPIILTIRHDEYGCSSNYNYSWVLPRNDTPSGIDPFSFFISNVELNRTAAGVYYICIRPMHASDVVQSCSGYLNYTISTYSGSCRYWNEVENSWEGDGCEVTEWTSPTKTCCLCDHLTSFGGGFFVAPNPIDFGKALAGFSDLASNPTVFAFVISILGLYLILVIWARRADLKDVRKAGVTILPGNDHRDAFSYEITVYTGFSQNAGTTADVYLRLIGSLGDSEPRLLKDLQVPRFQRGAVDKFLLTVPQSLGYLREIHIWHNNSGKSPGWFLFRMQIRDCQTQRKCWFVCNKWLAVDEDDGKVERRIKTASQRELTRFNILFINATRRNLLDGHLWLSVYTRPVQSTFTRVQRLSCCFSLLMCTMLTNAMFYQRGGGPTDTTVTLGPIQLSWSLIMIGIQSSFIVMPVNLLLVTIFRKLAPKEQKSKNYEEEEANIEDNVKDREVEQAENAETEELEKNIKYEAQTNKKKKFMFPYWFIYVAYALCFVTSLTCATFTIFYGFTFGKEKSEKWLSAMMVSFFQSVIVIQPFKVFLLGLFFALIIKDPNKEEEDLEADYEPTEENVKDSPLDVDSYAVKMGIQSKPPGEDTLERVRALRLKEKQMASIIREILLHFLVVIIVLFVAYGNHDNKSFPYNRRAIDLLTQGIPYFTKIKNDHNFWDWTNHKLIPNLYPVNELIGYPYMDIMRNKKKSNMVGVGRLRQLRNKKHTCEVPLIFTGKFEDCTEDYSWSNEETNQFLPGWKPTNHSRNSTSTMIKTKKTPWEYTSAWEIKGFPYMGKMATYRGGGYIMDLGPTNDTAFKTLDILSQNNWIDQYTRAIFTEINIYSVDINLMCVITLLYEFLPCGGGISSINVQTIKLYRYLSSIAKAVMGFEVIFIFLVFYWIYRDCKKISTEGKKYWKCFWNVIDSLITSLSICSVGVYIARLVFIDFAIDQFHRDRNKFVCFQYVVLLNEVQNFLSGCVVILCNLKFLRLLRFNRKVSMLSDTLRHSAKMILSFFVMIVIVMFAFCAMANQVFGSVLEEYRTVIRSMVSLFSMMLGEFDFQNLNDSNRIIGPVMFFFFMVLVQFILVNMFIGILSDNFNMVRMDAAKQSNEYEIVDFMMRRLSSYVGYNDLEIKPDYKWPKTSLEMQVEMIDEKTDVIINYMRNLCDEDLRTSIWLESEKSTDKKDKIISFALNAQQLDLENDLFDSIPVLLKNLDKITNEDFAKLSKKESQSNISDTDYGSSFTLSAASEVPDDDDSDTDSACTSEDARSLFDVQIEIPKDDSHVDSQARRKSIHKKS